jgi:hypothetical protein
MDQQQHGHHHEHGHHHGSHPQSRKRGLHRDWRVWVVVGLMLAAMLVYIFTLDESIAPWNRK